MLKALPVTKIVKALQRVNVKVDVQDINGVEITPYGVWVLIDGREWELVWSVDDEDRPGPKHDALIAVVKQLYGGNTDDVVELVVGHGYYRIEFRTGMYDEDGDPLHEVKVGPLLTSGGIVTDMGAWGRSTP